MLGCHKLHPMSGADRWYLCKLPSAVCLTRPGLLLLLLPLSACLRSALPKWCFILNDPTKCPATNDRLCFCGESPPRSPEMWLRQACWCWMGMLFNKLTSNHLRVSNVSRRREGL